MTEKEIAQAEEEKTKKKGAPKKDPKAVEQPVEEDEATRLKREEEE